ncbi:MAG: DUF5606 domain-containing protein [Bacteroidetes bacterium]|nr:DUF5606 domain-containing protein [Bacteroidota bacterium]MBS1739051.1 DUF5606 domain-containing protein [Bacteroidota bacterium]
MDYREIVSVTGIGGLFQLMATKSDGAIVRNLADKATKFIPARLHNVTPLESIEVYTTGDNVRLHHVFEQMKQNSSVPMPDPKKADNGSIKAYFKEVFPQMDEDRVYVSDQKKMLKWFEILKANDLLNFDFYNQPEAEAESTEPTVVEEPVADEKPAKKSRTKKAAEEISTTEGEEKPKKAARKKKSEDSEALSEEKPAKKTAKKKTSEE